MDDLGFSRTPDRPVKLLETCVRYLMSVETSIGARGPDFLGGSTTQIPILNNTYGGHKNLNSETPHHEQQGYLLANVCRPSLTT